MGSSLTPLEAIMWRTGHDPALRMTIGNLTILDRVPDVEDLVARLAHAAGAAPRLQWRIDDPSRTRVRPCWADTTTFDASDHVRVLAVAPPGDLRQVLDLVALVDATEFDAVRSPWDVTLISGLADGRAALYMRADHVLTDGLGGTQLAALLLDPVEAGGHDRPAPASPSTPGPTPAGGRRPGTVTVTVDLTTIARPIAAGISAARTVDPVNTVVRGVQQGVELLNSVSHQLVVSGGPLSPLVVSGAMGTRFEVLSIHGARHAAVRHGGSRNVLLIAAVAAGLGDYHDRQGHPVATLRLGTPVLVRRSSRGGGNSFSPIRVEVPTGCVPAGTHFGIVADRLARARHEPATQLTGPLAVAINRLPSRALVPAARAQISTVDFIATALPGRRDGGTICGAAVESSYPFGPRAGRLVNVTALGNADRLDIGIALDPVAVRRPDELVACIESAFSALVDEAGGPMAG